MKKMTALLLCATICTANFTVCQAVEETASDNYPLTITTYNYEKEEIEVTFDKAPEKVWVQNQNNIETMLALGLEDKIAGACGLDGEVREDLQDEFEKINFYENMPSKEEVIALEPDCILGWYSTFDDKRLGDVDFWNERGVGTYMSLNSGCRSKDENPQTIEDECEDILTIGKIFDVEEKAQELVDEITGEVKKINEHLEGKEKLTAAVLEDEGGTYRVYSEDTLGGNVAVNAGADLSVGKHGENGNISAEDLIAANPDAIFMVWYDGYGVNDTEYNGENVTELITKDPKFASLDAVKNNRVFAINLSGIYCSGLRTLDGILDISTSLYPELYK